MNNIIRFWNQNRKQIIIGVVGIAFLIIIIQVFNEMARQSMLEEQNTMQNKENTEGLPTQSIITGETIDTETTKENKNLIEEFVKYCNEKNTTKAYELLTDECKEILFKTEDEFIEYYYNVIFTEAKVVDIENFRNSSNRYTYVVQYYNDVLATGEISDADVYKDYITIDGSTQKININSFIDSKEINKTDEFNGIKIEVKQQQIYKDYEKYVISVENTTEKKILLDTRTDSRSIYVLGSDNVKYSAYAHEILSNMYEIPEYATKTYTFKYDKIYNPSVVSKKIGFTDIVLDYENYIQNPIEENKRTRIIVEF